MSTFNVFPADRRRYFSSMLARQAGPNALDEMLRFPAQRTEKPPTAVEAPGNNYDALKEYMDPDTSRLESLEAQAAEKPGWKERLFRAIIPAAGLGIAGAVGGAEGLRGGAAGISSALSEDQARRDLKENQLREDIENERKRVERMKQFGIEQAGLERYRTGTLESKEDIADIRRMQAENKFEIDKQKNIIAQQRADAFSDNVRSLATMRVVDAEREADNLERQTNRDNSINENERLNRQQTLQIAKMQINQRKAEEQGRTDRERLRQEAVSLRQRQMIESGQLKPSDVALLYDRAIAAAKNIGYYDQMEPEDQADLINNIAGSLLQKSVPALGPGQGSPILGGLFGNREAITAQTPAAQPAAAQTPAQAQPQFPPELLPTLKPNVGTRLSDGSLWTLGKNGQPEMVEPPKQ